MKPGDIVVSSLPRVYFHATADFNQPPRAIECSHTETLLVVAVTRWGAFVVSTVCTGWVFEEDLQVLS